MEYEKLEAEHASKLQQAITLIQEVLSGEKKEAEGAETPSIRD